MNSKCDVSVPWLTDWLNHPTGLMISWDTGHCVTYKKSDCAQWTNQALNISVFAKGWPIWAEATHPWVSIGQAKVFFHLGIFPGFTRRSHTGLLYPALTLWENSMISLKAVISWPHKLTLWALQEIRHVKKTLGILTCYVNQYLYYYYGCYYLGWKDKKWVMWFCIWFCDVLEEGLNTHHSSQLASLSPLLSALWDQYAKRATWSPSATGILVVLP